MAEVQGNLQNIRENVIEEIKSIYDMKIPQAQIFTRELNEKMLCLTDIIKREIAVYLNRHGKVVSVAVGENATVNLPKINERGKKKLSGIRCIHTHPNGDATLSSLDLSSLRRLKFDMMIAIAKKDDDIFASISFLTGEANESGTESVKVIGKARQNEFFHVNFTRFILFLNKEFAKTSTTEVGEEEERAILAGLVKYGEEELDELKRLAETAGAKIVGRVWQKKEKSDNALFFGKGKVDEITMLCQNADATVLLVDDELTPTQERNLESAIGIKVVDRTALILDIFALRARSKEGKLQVSLAQMKYNLPRLMGKGVMLSRLGGGIGTRGPGETKLETDRRILHKRITELEREMEEIRKTRALSKRGRQTSNIPLVALVGYTNAGKSTLLNTLTGADVYAKDELFATLDTTTRRLILEDNREVLVTDTVGFIKKLPHTLISAFRATLEEVKDASLLIHVVDASSPDAKKEMEAAANVLLELDALDKPTIYVFNKSDKIDEETKKRILIDETGIFISAKRNENISSLKERIADFFANMEVVKKFLIPFDKGNLIGEIRKIATVNSTEYTEKGAIISVSIAKNRADTYKDFEI